MAGPAVQRPASCAAAMAESSTDAVTATERDLPKGLQGATTTPPLVTVGVAIMMEPHSGPLVKSGTMSTIAITAAVMSTDGRTDPLYWHGRDRRVELRCKPTATRRHADPWPLVGGYVVGA